MSHIRITHPDAPDTGEWVLAQHVTVPRKSCLGLPRQYAPPPDELQPEPGDAHPHYVGVYLESVKPHRWYYKLVVDTGREVCGYGYPSPARAAQAYDALVRAFGLNTRLNFGSEGKESA